jgi:hypothetical protein
VQGKSVLAIGDGRTGKAAGGTVRAEHEIVDQQLRAATEKVSSGLLSRARCQSGNPFPHAPKAAPRQRVTAADKFLLAVQQFEPHLQLFVIADDMIGHGAASACFHCRLAGFPGGQTHNLFDAFASVQSARSLGHDLSAGSNDSSTAPAFPSFAASQAVVAVPWATTASRHAGSAANPSYQRSISPYRATGSPRRKQERAVGWACGHAMIWEPGDYQVPLPERC